MVTHDPKAAVFGTRELHLEKGNWPGSGAGMNEAAFEFIIRRAIRKTGPGDGSCSDSVSVIQSWLGALARIWCGSSDWVHSPLLINAVRNQRRATLTVLSVASSCALLVALLTLQRELTVPPESEGHPSNHCAGTRCPAQPLPAKQLAIVEDSRSGGFALHLFGGITRGDGDQLRWFAVDPARFRGLLVEGRISGWIILTSSFVTGNSCFVGADTMKRYNLKIGDRMKFRTGTFIRWT